MNIKIDKITIEFTESEIWDIIFCMKHELEDDDKFSHSLEHSGRETYLENYGKKVSMYRQICYVIGRPDLYEDLIRLMDKKFGKKAPDAN